MGVSGVFILGEGGGRGGRGFDIRGTALDPKPVLKRTFLMVHGASSEPDLLRTLLRGRVASENLNPNPQGTTGGTLIRDLRDDLVVIMWGAT